MKTYLALVVLGALACLARAQCPPAAPTGIVASDDTCAGVVVTWVPVTGASYYEIWKSVYIDFSAASLIGTSVNTSFTDLLAVPGEVRVYWVTAFRVPCLPGSNRSGANADIGIRGGAPAAPTGVNASDDLCASVEVSWSASSGATIYEVYRDPGGNPATSTLIGTSVDTNLSDPLAVGGQTYTYWIVARSLCGGSAFSTGDSGIKVGAPAAPTGVSASDDLCLSVEVSWNTVADASIYEVYRDADGIAANSSLIGTSIDTNFSDALTTSGQTYTYWVVSRNLCGGSAFSAGDTGTKAGAPLAPTGVNASEDLCNSVEISWNASEEATLYEVYRDPDGNVATSSLIGTTMYADLSDLLAAGGQTYTYWVVARNVCGGSALSDSDTGNRTSDPAAPAVVDATDEVGCRNGIHVSWSGSPDALLYEVWRSPDGTFDSATPVGTSIDLEFLDLTPLTGTTYTYWVRATTLCGVGALSPSDEGTVGEDPPAAPVILRSGSICFGVGLLWQWDIADVSVYEVWRSSTNNLELAVLVGTTSPANPCAAAWIVDSVAPGTYTYWIRARNTCGASEYSESVTETSWVLPPPPTDVQATDGTVCDGILVTWMPPPGAPVAEYVITRTLATAEEEFHVDGAESQWIDTTAQPGETYTYTVRSISVVAPSELLACYQVLDGSDPTFVRCLGLDGFPNDGFRADALSIFVRPGDQVVNPCQTAEFPVVPLDGTTPLAYQWRREGLPIVDGPAGASPGGGAVSGSDTATLTITNPRAADEGSYDCVITDACTNSVTTMPANLTVCEADFDCSGTVDSSDFFGFLTAFFDGNADIDQNGVTDSSDFFAFLDQFFQGCEGP